MYPFLIQRSAYTKPKVLTTDRDFNFVMSNYPTNNTTYWVNIGEF